MNKKLMTILLSLSFVPLCWSSGNSAPHVDLYKKADVVILGQVTQGKLIASGHIYSLVVKPIQVFKGLSVKGEMEVMHDASIFSEIPNELGAMYVLFLSEDQKRFKVLPHKFSVFQVEYLDMERPDFKLALERLNLLPENIVSFNGDHLYPVVCSGLVGKESLCKNTFRIFENLQNASKPGQQNGTSTNY